MSTDDQYKNPGIVIGDLKLRLLVNEALKNNQFSTTDLRRHDSSATNRDITAAAIGLAHMGLFEQLGAELFKKTDFVDERAKVIQILDNGAYEFMGRPITTDCWQALMQACQTSWNDLNALAAAVSSHLGVAHSTPQRIERLRYAFDHLLSIHDLTKWAGQEAYCEATVIACRTQLLLEERNRQDLSRRARDRDVLKSTDAKIEALKTILELPALQQYRSIAKPRLTDFVNVGIVEQKREQKPAAPRTPDEKFAILSAPALFALDYDEFADSAFSRDRSFAVAFIDIDDFKKFNSTHKETLVDLDMLPHFMRALEAYCYGRAIAYRQGGDEYLVLLRNSDAIEARAFFDGLRKHIAKIPYDNEGIRNARPTVSIGVHVIDAAHEENVFSAQFKANAAKDWAKKQGKNRVVLWTDVYLGCGAVADGDTCTGPAADVCDPGPADSCTDPLVVPAFEGSPPLSSCGDT